MQLSIIIVSYNALPFLDLTLRSVRQALSSIDSEVILIDNSSKEPILPWVESHFPEVKIIKSQENLGFGRANNLGLEMAKGKYVLYLNPDTIVNKRVINSALSKMESDSDIGALGLRMINGNGIYLPESKRSVPTLWSTFCRIIGLSALFPKSKVFSSYRLGHISETAITEVEVLSGAFMILRNEPGTSLQFDSEFFMYGEDIDLSYRIKKAGKKVLYFGDETIIHFKGESTNKKDWAFHYWFYRTMWLFRKKHASGLQSFWNWLILPSISILTIISFIKANLNVESVKKAKLDVQGINVKGDTSDFLSDLMKKYFNSIGPDQDSSSELQVFNLNSIDFNGIIEFLNTKQSNQKVLFWNSELKQLFGSFSKDRQGKTFI